MFPLNHCSRYWVRGILCISLIPRTQEFNFIWRNRIIFRNNNIKTHNNIKTYSNIKTSFQLKIKTFNWGSKLSIWRSNFHLKINAFSFRIKTFIWRSKLPIKHYKNLQFEDWNFQLDNKNFQGPTAAAAAVPISESLRAGSPAPTVYPRKGSLMLIYWYWYWCLIDALLILISHCLPQERFFFILTYWYWYWYFASMILVSCAHCLPQERLSWWDWWELLIDIDIDLPHPLFTGKGSI